MLAICIECSHQRGMGHLFRALNLIRALEERGKTEGADYILLVNEDQTAEKILREQGITPRLVDLTERSADWEGALIRKAGITVWLNDRLDTTAESAAHVKAAGCRLFTIDDRGEGAALADGNFASLAFEQTEEIPGRKVYAGCRYLILNQEIALHRRLRTKPEKILVTLGGSDTYGVTLRVIDFLKRRRRQQAEVAEWEKQAEITILLGPGSVIRQEAEAAVRGTNFALVSSVPSLPAFFAGFDFAVTGGGVTAFEAAASGLPCMIIANEYHEVQIGKYLESRGCAIFAGYHKEMDLGRIGRISDLALMSRRGMEAVDLAGADRICQILLPGSLPAGLNEDEEENV